MDERRIAERYMEAVAANDVDALDLLVHDDYQLLYPQSGERIRGRRNRRAAFGGPAWSVVHLAGWGDSFTLTGTVRYPNGETWHAIALLTVRDEKIWRETEYFAPPLDAPLSATF